MRGHLVRVIALLMALFSLMMWLGPNSMNQADGMTWTGATIQPNGMTWTGG